MRAALLSKAGGPLDVVEDVDLAEPGPGLVRVRVSHCGICHSDLTVIDSGSLVPMVAGHEAAGRVEQVGPGVRRLAPGDSVVLTPLGPCGRCYWCVRGEHTICEQARSFMAGTLSDGASPLSRAGETVFQGLGVGGFAECTLVEERNAVKVEPDVPLHVACVIGCALQTGVGAVLNAAGAEAGATVLVLGLGGIGISVVQGARIAGASRIIVSDPVVARREAAATFGATDAIDPSREDVVSRAHALTGGIGVDYAFDAAGLASLVEDGIAATRIGGTTVMVGAPPADQSVRLDPAIGFLAGEKKLRGTMLGSCHSHLEVGRLIGLWRQGRLQLEEMISQRYPLAEINAGIEDLRASRGIRSVIEMPS